MGWHGAWQSAMQRHNLCRHFRSSLLYFVASLAFVCRKLSKPQRNRVRHRAQAMPSDARHALLEGQENKGLAFHSFGCFQFNLVLDFVLVRLELNNG